MMHDNSEEYTFNIGGHKPQMAKPFFQIRIMDTSTSIMADSGATMNTASKRDFDSLKPRPQLMNSSVKVYPYMSAELLNLCGKLQASIVVLYLAGQHLIKAVSTVEQPPVNLPSGAPDFLQDFLSLTNGMDEYKGESVRIHVDESIKPVAQPHCHIPFHVWKQVEEKLRQLQNNGIIECTEGPTAWV